MSDPQWFYTDLAGAQRGPVAASFLRAAFAQGQLRPDDMVWRDGMANWARHADVAELTGGAAAASPPPLMRAPATTTHAPAGIAYAGITYAGFWRRYLALVLDSIVLALPLIVLAVVLGLAGGSSSDESSALVVLVYLAYWVAAPLYYSLQESSAAQATLGKRALGIKVTDLEGGRLTFGNALGRWFAAALSYLTLYIGFLMAAFTTRRQALHDMVAGTLVVDRWAFTAHPQRQKTGLSGWLIALLLVLVLGVPVLGILAAIAIPAYQDYTTRAKVMQAIASGAPAKPVVAQFVANQSRCPSNGEAGLASADAAWGAYAHSVTVGTMESGSCGIEITTANTDIANVDGMRIWLEFDAPQQQWACHSEIADRYLPVNCRG